MKLENRVAVVTGAARGIGLALVERLLGRGARVVLVDADADELARVVAGLPEGRALALVADVRSRASLGEAVESVLTTWGGIDVWVNNAGLARHRWIPDYTEEEIELMLDVNLKGTILGSQLALRHMQERKAGHIVNVISTASLRGIPSETVYCAAKWGVRGFTQGLAEEGAAFRVRVTALLPGGVDTAFWTDASEREAPRQLFLKPEHVADAVVQCLEMDDFCVPRELVVRSLDDSDFAVRPA